MYREYYTMVSASSGFWERFLMKQIGEDLSCRIGFAGICELNIISTNGPALDEITRLSKDFPDEVFHVKIAEDNIYENYIYHYECSAGHAKLIREGFEYCFGINAYDRDRLPEGLFEKFRKTATEIYLKLEKENTTNSPKDPNLDLLKTNGGVQGGTGNEKDHNEKKNRSKKQDNLDNITILVRYETPKICITARKMGLTFIDVEVEFRNEEKTQLPKITTDPDFDESPF